MLLSLRHLTILAISAFLIIPPLSASRADSLPELGDSAATLLSSEQETLLGQQIMRNAKRRMHFENDYLALDYLKQLTRRLAAHAPRAFGESTTHLVIDSRINAFAVPGGHLAFNSGLIAESADEGELASVIAHEIAHQSQRHIARILERSKEHTLPATAALIGGLLIGGQAGVAAITSVNAALISDQLTYSRGFEKEADATGISILAKAGFDPHSMSRFFTKLEQQTRLSGSDVPEFLRSHPLSSNRIANSRAKAEALSPSHSTDTHPSNTWLDYDALKTRIIALYSDAPQTRLQAFQQRLKSQPHDTLATYGAALALQRQGKYPAAIAILKPLLTDPSTPPYLKLALADIQIQAQDLDAALAILTPLYQQDSNQSATVASYATALIINAQTPTAIRILRKHLRRHPEHHQLTPILVRAYGSDGQTASASIEQAQYELAQGDPEAADATLAQIKKGKAPTSDYENARIQSLLQQAKRQIRYQKALTID